MTQHVLNPLRLPTWLASAFVLLFAVLPTTARPEQLPSSQPVPALPGDRIEYWIGTIYLPNAACPQVTFVTTFSKHNTDPWSATLSITPGCSVRGLIESELTGVVYTDDIIQFVSPATQSENFYDVKLDADKKTARGQLLLGRQQAVLIRMRRATEAEARDAAPRRPQMPVGPFPYDARELSFTNSDDAITLTGLVTIPRNESSGATAAPAPTPSKRAAVILLADENPQDLNQSEGFHKPGLVLADFLTRQGLIVFRFDERGTGKSGGASPNQTLLSAADDVKAAAAVLATLPEVDPSRIGLIGRGEGATVAAIAAAENPGIAFAVLMAPAAAPWKHVLVLREQRVLEAQGEDPEFIKSRMTRYTRLLDRAASGKDMDLFKVELRADIVERGKAQRTGGVMTEFQMNDLADSQIDYFSTLRVQSSLNLDPKPYMEKLCCPVLALAGSLDMHTPAKDTMPAVEAALRACRDAKPTFKLFPATNHWFQPCNTGFDDEFDKIELTISPEVLNVIADWLRQTTAAKP